MTMLKSLESCAAECLPSMVDLMQCAVDHRDQPVNFTWNQRSHPIDHAGFGPQTLCFLARKMSWQLANTVFDNRELFCTIP